MRLKNFMANLFMGKFTFHSELHNSWINSDSILSCKRYEQRPTYKLMGKFPFHSELRNISANPVPFQVSNPCQIPNAGQIECNWGSLLVEIIRPLHST